MFVPGGNRWCGANLALISNFHFYNYTIFKMELRLSAVVGPGLSASDSPNTFNSLISFTGKFTSLTPV